MEYRLYLSVCLFLFLTIPSNKKKQKEIDHLSCFTSDWKCLPCRIRLSFPFPFFLPPQARSRIHFSKMLWREITTCCELEQCDISLGLLTHLARHAGGERVIRTTWEKKQFNLVRTISREQGQFYIRPFCVSLAYSQWHCSDYLAR